MVKLIENLLNNEMAPDFSDPLGLLKACHQRILGFCDMLEKIVDHIAVQDVDDEVKQAAKKIYRYFSTAAILHHQDEEQSLFPMLVGESLKIATIIHELKQDHTTLDDAWQRIEPVLAKPDSIRDIDNFNQHVAIFCSTYRAHIQKEEDDFLSMAQHILSTEQLEQLGKQMQERRQPKISKERW